MHRMMQFLTALVLTFLVAERAMADVDLSRMSVEPNPRLGLAFPGSNPKYYEAIADAGIGVTRISASWGQIEPREGRFDFRGLDKRVSGLLNLGIQPFLTFESNADWATEAGTRKVKNGTPRDLAQWQRMIRTVVDRYDADGRNDMPGLRAPVRYYQAANEWISETNGSGGWAGTTEQLIAYINAAHDAVAAEDPDATFVLGGIASFNSDILLVSKADAQISVRQKWSRTSETVLEIADMKGPEISSIIQNRVLPVLARTKYDLASVHLYGPEGRDAARLALVRRFANAPVISTECGGPTLDYDGRYSDEGHFRAVVHRNLNVLAAGGRFCLWFRLGEGPGATYGNSRTALYKGPGKPKPGVYAYRLLSRLLDPATNVSRRPDGRFELRRSDGRRIEIAWGSTAPAVTREAAAAGHEVLCLSDPAAGMLSSDPARCNPDAPVIAGPGLSALLAN